MQVVYRTNKQTVGVWYLAYNKKKSIVSFGEILIGSIVTTSLMKPEIFTTEDELNNRKIILNIQ
jgi:hypothetical protein